MSDETHVVMRNDFPAAVYDDKADAETRCFRENHTDLERVTSRGGFGMRIYWTFYTVPLNPPARS